MKLLRSIKEALYFPLAYYFRLFALIRLRRWKPRIIVVTGSSGKTTLLNLVYPQLRMNARYSHKANSSYGIPFNILGLERKTFLFYEWPLLCFLAPLAVFKSLPRETIYVVEVDCDRPGEGKFLATLLKPEITLWLTSSKTHSMNFDEVVRAGRFSSIEKAVAYEFGTLTALTTRLAIVNGDSELVSAELPRSKAEIKRINREDSLQEYQINARGQSHFRIDGKDYVFNYLLPEETFYSIKMTLELLGDLGIRPDYSFSRFTLPPGRSSVFEGIKNTTIVDSSYNANLDSMRVILEMFSRMPAATKWVILGDMIEQGQSEEEEHEKLAGLISKYKFDRVLLMGPRVSSFTYPRLLSLTKAGESAQNSNVERFLTPAEVLNYLKNNLQGGETILFKGARFLEGVIEHLLVNKDDVKKLCRQEKVWKIRRRQWGL